MNKHRDFFGTELKIGDLVAFGGWSQKKLARIIGMSERKIIIEIKNDKYRNDLKTRGDKLYQYLKNVGLNLNFIIFLIWI